MKFEPAYEILILIAHGHRITNLLILCLYIPAAVALMCLTHKKSG